MFHPTDHVFFVKIRCSTFYWNSFCQNNFYCFYIFITRNHGIANNRSWVSTIFTKKCRNTNITFFTHIFYWIFALTSTFTVTPILI